MYENITEQELEFLEHYFDPTSLTENLFPANFNSPQTWDAKEKSLYLRPYQFAMQNYSYIIADDPDLDDKANFAVKKLAGDLYSIGARNLGKSFWLIIDVVLSTIHRVSEGCVASFNKDHLVKVTESIASYIDGHKFLKTFHLKSSKKDSINRSPFKVVTEHGTVLYGVNEQVESPNPGVEFHSKHFLARWYEEFSYSSAEGHKKSVDAESSLGHIERPSGIPDLCIGSPLGKILTNKKLKNWMWRLPQMVREDWDAKVEQEKIEEYNGKGSVSYGLNVLAETVEGAFGFWDIARLKEMCFKKGGLVKSFEITKDSYKGFEERLVVERLAGSTQVFICADIGTGSAPTEIAIIFFDGKKYKYIYNISLFRLIQEEQSEVFYWLYEKLGSAFVAVDATGDNGVIIDYLTSKGVNPEHLLKVKFNENLEVDFERDKDGTIITDKEGNPVMKEANTMDFSMKEMEKLFYNGLLELPPDAKFLTQFTAIIAKQTKLKTLYGSKTGEDHLHQAFQVFAICKFFNEFKILKNTSISSDRCYGVFNVRKN